jgi:hypothetical protein
MGKLHGGAGKETESAPQDPRVTLQKILNGDQKRDGSWLLRKRRTLLLERGLPSLAMPQGGRGLIPTRSTRDSSLLCSP